MAWLARHRGIGLFFYLAAAGLALGQPAVPAERPVPALNQAVDVSLIMTIDASGSVDDDRFELQKQGYAKAFLNPRVLNAIRNGSQQVIAVSMVQWTGPAQQVVMVPWRPQSPADCR